MTFFLFKRARKPLLRNPQPDFCSQTLVSIFVFRRNNFKIIQGFLVSDLSYGDISQQKTCGAQTNVEMKTSNARVIAKVKKRLVSHRKGVIDMLDSYNSVLQLGYSEAKLSDRLVGACRWKGTVDNLFECRNGASLGSLMRYFLKIFKPCNSVPRLLNLTRA